MLSIDLAGKRALVAGVADDGGFGFAIAKSLAEAGAQVSVATWPPALNIFLSLLDRGKIDDSRRLRDGSLLQFEKIYPLDAAFDTLEDAPAGVRENKRYRDLGDFSIDGLGKAIEADFGPEQADTFRRDLHPDLRADYVLANPPFNDSDWFRKDDDVTWQLGVGATLIPAP